MMRWGKKKDKTWMRMMTMIMRMRDGINKQMIYSDYDDQDDDDDDDDA